MKNLFVPGMLFEELGFRYFGPVDGHDIISLVETLRKVLSLKECSLLHVITKKGNGCSFAEKDIEKGHGVTPFNVKTGEKIKSPKEIERAKEEGVAYTKAFVQGLIKVAKEDPRVVAITAAMPSGTGLADFQKEFPERFFDVGIAEQHAVTFAGALSKGGFKPVCAIYSTFLQRSQDQLLHDIALQRLPLLVCLDRAGLVGADGATHNGVFDISYLGHIPEVVIAAPKDEREMETMIRLGVNYPHLFAIRYPRGNVPRIYDDFPSQPFKIGEGEILREGDDATLFALGSMVETALKAREILKRSGVEVRVVNARFARPLDGKLILDSLAKSRFFFTLEEHVAAGGLGAKVLEFLEKQNVHDAIVHRFALPDQFIEHGSREIIMDHLGLSSEKIAAKVLDQLKTQAPISLPNG